MAGHPLIGIVIQARMGSTRLPGKVLMPIGGRPLLAHILSRLTRLKHPVQTVVATSSDPRDDAVAVFAQENGVHVFRGSEPDVLDRYYRCALQFHFDHIVRLTGDNPFVDVAELDRLIERHLRNRADYSSSIGSLPEGVGTEIFTFAALETSHARGHKHHHREHVNEYILENPTFFRIVDLAVPQKKNRPDVRLTVDTPDDYDRVCRIAAACGDSGVDTTAAITLADRNLLDVLAPCQPEGKSA